MPEAFPWLADAGRMLLMAGIILAAAWLAARVDRNRRRAPASSGELLLLTAAGGLFAILIVSDDLASAAGARAIVLLAALLAGLGWLASRNGENRGREPALIFHRGRFLRGALSRERLTEEEVIEAVRGEGIWELDDVEEIIVETDGRFGIVKRSRYGAW